MKHKRMSSLLTRLAITFLVIGLIAGIASSAMAAKDPSAITTDKTKYSLGEPIVISGSGFTADGTVNIEVQLPGNNGIDTLPPEPTDAAGSFQTSYTPPIIPGRYKITATDGINTAKTAVTQADAIGYNKGVYKKDTTAIVLPTGKWTTGNAGKYYKEDQWAYYQYEITGIPGDDVPTFNVVFNHYQSNTNAIFIDALCDFRYAWNTPMLPDDTPYPGTSTTTWHTRLPNKINWAYDPSTHTLSYPSTDAPAEVNGFAVDDPASMFATGAPTTGTNTLVIYFRAHLSSSTVWMAGDEANLGTLIPPDDAAVPSGAAGIFGEDVYSGWSAPFYGVGFASGSSRHFNLQDQSAGPAGAITLPIPTVGANYLIIQKVTDPTPATGALFGFTASGDDISPTTFTLDTDPGTTTIYELIRFSDLPTGHGAHAVDYTFTETTLPEHWSLTDITCEDILGTSTFTIDLSSKTVTVRLDADGAAICTFTNTLLATPTIETLLSKSLVAIGESVYDTATLIGATADAGGTVTYKAYDNDTCSGTALFTDTVTVTNGVVPNSASTSFSAAGDYYWQATYSGDANNVGPVSSVCTSEHLVVNPNEPTIGTTPNPETATVGDTLHDSATLSGATADAGGTITFKLFGPGDPTCSGVPVHTEVVAVSGSGVYNTVTGYVANAVGIWNWVAEYSGDGNNKPVSHPCTAEQVVVNVVKVLKTETIGGTPSGTLTHGYEFVLTGGPDVVERHRWANIGDTTPVTLDFGVLKPGDYTLCELAVPAGTTSTLETVYGGTVDTTTGNVCLDFTLGAGEERIFEIDNSWPGGGTRTIGYWKDWNSCSHDGAFVDRAAKTGNHLADDFLPILIGDLKVNTACIAMDILNKSPIDGGRKAANDAAYSLAAQLLAAKLNVAAGAGHSGYIDGIIGDAQALLAGANFDGTGIYWKGGKNAAAERQIALELAGILDQYNNGTIP